MKTRIFKAVLIGLVVIGGFSAIVMLLWNAVVPGIFGWGIINYWQAMGLLALTRILFGGIGGHRMGMHGRHDGMFSGIGRGNPIREKWMKMTPEERKEFIRKRHEQMGVFGGDFFGHEECFNKEK